MLDIADSPAPGAHAEIWEKVVRKLRTESMPPAGDAPARSKPPTIPPQRFLKPRSTGRRPRMSKPGKLPLLHRLSRTEYQNAIRDLLAVDALPKEMDYSLLLPPDNASSGFDNIADLLFVSPTSMERYLDAAAKISRLAVGDPSTPGDGEYLSPVRRTYARCSCAMGFRSARGADWAVRTDFPLDGDYVFKVDSLVPAANTST